jgi:hypothetical protein
MCNLTTIDPLNNVCSIKAVHAVCSKCSILHLQDINIVLAVEPLTKVISMVDLSHEVAVASELVLASIDKLGQVLPLHLLAF